MTDRELMQQALDALELYQSKMSVQMFDDTAKALRERLAQWDALDRMAENARELGLDYEPMQPCAGRNCGSTNPNLHSAECFEDYEKSTGMKQWQGLTDEAIWLEYQRLWPFHPADEPTLAKDIVKFARAIEAKLNEKNHGQEAQ